MMEKSRILIVDDEEDLRKMLRFRLESAGYEVSEAADGQDGLEKARVSKPDLIILDLMLPKMDGFKVCRMLKFDERHKHRPIIIFTARAQKKDLDIGKEVRADAYIMKPFEPEMLLAKVKELLKQ